MAKQSGLLVLNSALFLMLLLQAVNGHKAVTCGALGTGVA